MYSPVTVTKPKTAVDPDSVPYLAIRRLTARQLQANPLFLAQRAELRQLRSQVSQEATLRLQRHAQAAAKDDRIKQLDSKNRQLENENKQLREKLARKNKLLDKERREKQAVKDQLNQLTSQTVKLNKTITRLSGMLFKISGKPVPKSKRRRGGQMGHKGSGRRGSKTNDDGEPLPPDQVIRCFLPNCPDCGQALSRTNSCQSHTITDIPQLAKLLAKVIRYDIEQQWCGNCCKRAAAKPPELLPHSKVGLNTIVLILTYRYTCHIPLHKIKYLLDACYQLQLSAGGIQNILNRAKTWFGEQYGELLLMLRAARIKYADETGWKIAGIRSWIWGFFTQKLAYYVASPLRGGGVPAKVLFDVDTVKDLPAEVDVNQLLIRDDYSGYQRLPLLQQSCWAHLLRFAKEEYDSAPKKKESKILYITLRALYRKLARALHQDQARKDKVYAYAWEALTNIIQAEYCTDQAKAIQTRIANQGQKLLTALKFEGAELTNNYAERNIRPMAVARKIGGGSRSDNGAETLAVNASIIQTIKLQNKDMVKTLTNIITGQPTGLFVDN